MTHPVPTKGFLQLSPEAAMLSGPSVETPCSARRTYVPRTLPEVKSQAKVV